MDSILRALIIVACACPLAAQSGVPPEVLRLARIKRQMKQNLARLPDFTCLETIERARRASAAKPFRKEDTLRLEVALSGGKEMYAWPGSRSFESTDPVAMVGQGTIGTGLFAGHARDVFVNEVATIRYAGEENLDGHPTYRYDYVIPYIMSGWTVGHAGQTARVAGRGSFWAAAESLDVLRLRIEADDLPPGQVVTGVTEIIDYARVRMGGAQPLLPQSAVTLMTLDSGIETRNHTEFSHCRQYAGEARLVNGTAPAAVPDSTRTPPRLVEIPAGLTLLVRLDTPVDSRNSVVGDPLRAHLDAAVTRGRTELLPKAAILEGRVRRLDRHPGYFVVGLEFSRVAFDGAEGRFFAALVATEPQPGLRMSLSRSRTETRDYSGGRIEQTFTESTYLQNLPGVGSFFMEGDSFQLPRGLLMTWRTQPPWAK